ncbi:hypothetical protein [Burkholderia contaminans]|uniref:hypothetical protein n=1 Tax=Burkholderia contaminans TaxID=488447 RepID=UPI0015E3050C|nr:hypothetical protein [Burkholderia contaminans]
MNELRIGSQVDCYRWQMAHLEEGSVYPGHPLVLATIVMFAFDDFESADEATEHGWCRALADSRIPGAGDHVGAAMRVLRHGRAGWDADAMVAEAHRYWDRGRAGGHDKNVAQGRAQAEKIEAVFRRMVATWLDPRAAPA